MEIHKPVRDVSVSNIEQESKQSAVAAVEARWQRAEKQRQLEKFRARMRNIIAVVVLLAIAGGVTYWYKHDGRSVDEMVRNFRGIAGGDALTRNRELYTGLLAVFQSKPKDEWKSSLAAYKMKTAPIGTVYHALVPRQPVGYDIYEITTAGSRAETLTLLSPRSLPVPVTQADFDKAVKKTGYLVESEGVVYTNGRLKASELAALQKRLKTEADSLR